MKRLSEIIADAVWSHTRAQQLKASVDLNGQALLVIQPRTTAAEVFKRAGFEGDALDIALGVAYGESSGYIDAVGDTTLVDAKWGPSIGLFQVRSLRNPLIFSVPDRYRYAWALLDPDFNAQAAYAISNKGTNWSPWSVYRSGAWEQYAGKDFALREGHKNAALWNL